MRQDISCRDGFRLVTFSGCATIAVWKRLVSILIFTCQGHGTINIGFLSVSWYIDRSFFFGTERVSRSSMEHCFSEMSGYV